MNEAEKIANDLLEIKAVSLSPKQPYTWASGIKSPIYCDNRLTISYPHVRHDIAKGLADLILKQFLDVECIAGTATAGIPHAAFIADILDLPMVYIRSKAKDHGQGNQIEGHFNPGEKMVVIDDLISTGGSVLKAVDAAKEAGANILGVAAIFTYELEEGKKNFSERHLPLITLTNYTTLIQVAQQSGYIQEDDLELLKKWRQNPSEAY